MGSGVRIIIAIGQTVSPMNVSCRIYQPAVISVGMVGNMLCFFTLIFSSLRYTSTCVYMAAISVLDSVILALDLCVLVRGYVGQTRFYFSNDWTCGFHNFLFYFSIHFDVLILLAMTVDRFVVVKFPLKAQSVCTPKSALKAVAAVGLFSFALNCHIFITRGMEESGDPKDPLTCWYTDPDVDFFMTKVYTWIDASIYSFIPFLSLAVLNFLIIRQVRTSRRFSKKFTQRPGRGKGNKETSISETEQNTPSNEQTPTDNQSSGSSIESNQASRENLNSSVSTITLSRQSDAPPGSQNMKSRSKSMTRRTGNSNITVMLLMVTFTFLLLSSPVVIFLLYKRYYWLPTTNAEKARARLVHAFVDNLMYTNHAINFLLYCISGRRFRWELGKLLSRCGLCRVIVRRPSHH